MKVRVATTADTQFLAEAFVDAARFVDAQCQDPFSRSFPSEVDSRVLALAGRLLGDESTLCLVYVPEGSPAACIVGQLTNAPFPMTMKETIGYINLCWVSEANRNRGVARHLCGLIEDWFRENGVGITQLSWFANNTVAREVWEKLGYTPYRVYSYKQLSTAD